jgi:tetratricopeptide (TPR) repeat protein
MATSYHQLGILAQRRGDYEEAERRYHQSLEIDERLGNQAGMATSFSQLDNLFGQLGVTNESLQLHARACLMRLRLQVPQVRKDLRAFARYRKELGVERFAGAFDAVAGTGAASQLQALLDQMTSAGEGAGQ